MYCNERTVADVQEAVNISRPVSGGYQIMTRSSTSTANPTTKRWLSLRMIGISSTRTPTERENGDGGVAHKKTKNNTGPE